MFCGGIEMKIGEWVKTYRKEHGLSMQAFGDMCGLSRAYISILEKGINPTTKKAFSQTIQTLQKIAEVTGLDLNILVKDQSVIINAEKKSNKSISLTADETELLALYKQLDPCDKAEIRGEIKGMLRAEKYQSKIEEGKVI